MARVRITVEAEADIDRIASYTIDKWGLTQAETYLIHLEDGFEMLALEQNQGSCIPLSLLPGHRSLLVALT